MNLLHLVHPLKAESDPIAALNPAVNVAWLQPDMIRAAHTAASLHQLNVGLNLHPQVSVIEVGAGYDAPDAGCVHCSISRWLSSLRKENCTPRARSYDGTTSSIIP